MRAELTQVTNTIRYKTRAYQCLVVDVISLSLEYVTAGRFRGSENDKDLLIDAGVTYKGGGNREEQNYN